MIDIKLFDIKRKMASCYQDNSTTFIIMIELYNNFIYHVIQR